ncbi:hypothetical protein [Streptomyces sp. NPDC004546]|uniref:hypothetical protein n=1 Tax=Streptomyces sp. NPDC004546 TaxID=3154282 RepID=UPI0033AAFA4F
MPDEHHHRPDRLAADTGPRLAPLCEDDWDPLTRELLAPIPRDADGRLAHVFTTLVRHPGLFERFLPFGSYLLSEGRLPDRTPRGGRRPTPVCCEPPTNCTGTHACPRPPGPNSPPTTTRHS